MRSLAWLPLLLSIDAAAQQKCDAKKLSSIDERLNVLSKEDVARELLQACPELRRALQPWVLRPTSNDVVRAELILLRARDAYVHGHYEEAIRIAREAIKARPKEVEPWAAMAVYDWLVKNQVAEDRARRIAQGLLPAPPRPPVREDRLRGNPTRAPDVLEPQYRP